LQVHVVALQLEPATIKGGSVESCSAKPTVQPKTQLGVACAKQRHESRMLASSCPVWVVWKFHMIPFTPGPPTASYLAISVHAVQGSVYRLQTPGEDCEQWPGFWSKDQTQ